MISEASGNRVLHTCVLDHTHGAPEKRLVGCMSASLYFIFFGNDIKSRYTSLVWARGATFQKNLFLKSWDTVKQTGLSHARLAASPWRETVSERAHLFKIWPN